MDQANIQKQVEEFLKSLGVPGFIVFGYKTEKDQFSIVSSYNEMPTNAAIKGLSRVLAEFTERALP
ncbi:MAG TPA: hypothetical protein VI913_01620 [Candidatus Peribacteraceae bacterium]|nr:hypothetical protein [Candidatus Peribacteraceae bacterium]